MFPSPVFDFLNITPFDKLYSEKYVIFDINGKQVQSGILSNKPIYVGDLDQGIYLIKHQKEIKKFVKN